MNDKLHRKIVMALDDYYGAPCAQIRHPQEIEALNAKIEALEQDNNDLNFRLRRWQHGGNAIGTNAYIRKLKKEHACSIADDKRYVCLYELANEFMATLGAEGEITIKAHSIFAEQWENALYAIDNGCPGDRH